MDAAATVTVPLTSPSGETVPFPQTSRKTPFTGASPHMLLLFSPMLDLRGSRTHSPARAPSFSRPCSADAAICPDGACMIVSLDRWTSATGWQNDSNSTRPRLRAVAYRMLGSTSEADDTVQEAWIRLSRANADQIDNLEAWLVTARSNSAGSVLRWAMVRCRRASRSRVASWASTASRIS
jgi:hypothetical protein